MVIFLGGRELKFCLDLAKRLVGTRHPCTKRLITARRPRAGSCPRAPYLTASNIFELIIPALARSPLKLLVRARSPCMGWPPSAPNLHGQTRLLLSSKDKWPYKHFFRELEWCVALCSPSFACGFCKSVHEHLTFQ